MFFPSFPWLSLMRDSQDKVEMGLHPVFSQVLVHCSERAPSTGWGIRREGEQEKRMKSEDNFTDWKESIKVCGLATWLPKHELNMDSEHANMDWMEKAHEPSTLREKL